MFYDFSMVTGWRAGDDSCDDRGECSLRECQLSLNVTTRLGGGDGHFRSSALPTQARPDSTVETNESVVFTFVFYIRMFYKTNEVNGMIVFL